MFPSTDGTKTNTAANPKATGRTPGFNWSDGATITSGKNINYANSPSVLIEQIQKEGNKIYSPDTCTLIPIYINSIFTSSNKISWNR